jgi:hypothetical protein
VEETVTVMWAELVFVVEASWWGCCKVCGGMKQRIWVWIMRSTVRNFPWTETCGWEVEVTLRKIWWILLIRSHCSVGNAAKIGVPCWVWHRITKKNKHKFLEEHDTSVLIY